MNVMMLFRWSVCTEVAVRFGNALVASLQSRRSHWKRRTSPACAMAGPPASWFLWAQVVPHTHVVVGPAMTTIQLITQSSVGSQILRNANPSVLHGLVCLAMSMAVRRNAAGLNGPMAAVSFGMWRLNPSIPRSTALHVWNSTWKHPTELVPQPPIVSFGFGWPNWALNQIRVEAPCWDYSCSVGLHLTHAPPVPWEPRARELSAPDGFEWCETQKWQNSAVCTLKSLERLLKHCSSWFSSIDLAMSCVYIVPRKANKVFPAMNAPGSELWIDCAGRIELCRNRGNGYDCCFHHVNTKRRWIQKRSWVLTPKFPDEAPPSFFVHDLISIDLQMNPDGATSILSVLNKMVSGGRFYPALDGSVLQMSRRRIQRNGLRWWGSCLLRIFKRWKLADFGRSMGFRCRHFISFYEFLSFLHQISWPTVDSSA